MNCEIIKEINFKNGKNKEFDDNKKLFSHPYGDEVKEFFNRLSDRFEKINNILASHRDNIKYSKIKIFDLLNLNNLGDINSNYNTIRNHLKKISLEDKYAALQKYNKMHDKLFLENNSKNLRIDNFLNDDNNKMIINNNNDYPNQNYNNNYIEFYEIEYLNLDLTPLIYVETQDQLTQMINEIKTYSTEIAVDLEHHQKESYLGITCLIQISTRFNDYIVDAIKLRPYLQQLNIIFTNPNIVKILHGSDFDVLWLQKDFGVYLVNMFDSGQAARILNFSSFSLAYLLSTICGVNPDKKYQLADWRIRPLPEDMLKYAREDTHYLLYCYDVLKTQLIKKSIIKSEPFLFSILLNFKKSSDLSLKEFLKPGLKEIEYYQMKSQNVSVLNKKQFSIMKIIYKFRDYIARKLDFSTNFILSNKILLQICKSFEFNDRKNFKNKVLEVLYSKENNKI